MSVWITWLNSPLLQKRTAELLKRNIIEGIIPESEEHSETCAAVADVLQTEIQRLQKFSVEELLAQRHARFRKF